MIHTYIIGGKILNLNQAMFYLVTDKIPCVDVSSALYLQCVSIDIHTYWNSCYPGVLVLVWGLALTPLCIYLSKCTSRFHYMSKMLEIEQMKCG